MQTEILIVGAGLSGLALARSLNQRGIDCQLVEARERVGGRILSIDSQQSKAGQTPADMGPSWIWPGQPRIAALLHELEIAVFEQYSSGFLVYEDELGQVRRDLDYSSMAGSLRIQGGIGRLTHQLAASLPTDRLHLNHPVSAIRRRGNAYQVDLQQPRGVLQLQAHKIVLALPPRIAVNCIEFDPALPAEVVRDLNAVPTWMAAHAKVFALYETPFWRDAGLSGDAISRRGPLMEVHDASAVDPGQGALFGFVGLAADSPARAPQTLIAEVRQQLQKLFGDDAAEPLDILVRDWARDQYTATAADTMIAQHPPYGLPASVAALADQGLLFASSEMAAQFGGFVEGALEASEYALKRV
jgi:monoamine oxidase